MDSEKMCASTWDSMDYGRVRIALVRSLIA